MRTDSVAAVSYTAHENRWKRGFPRFPLRFASTAKTERAHSEAPKASPQVVLISAIQGGYSPPLPQKNSQENIARGRYSKVGFFILFSLLWLSPPGSEAGLYTYRDENGTLHAVTRSEDIPEKFRGKEKQLASTESGSGEANLKLHRDGNSLLIPVSFGKAGEFLLVLDTGASVSMISDRIAEKLKARQINQALISTASGVIGVPIVEVPEMSVRQFSVRNLHVGVNNLPGKNRAEGLLGLDFLNHFRIQIDTETGQLHLERKAYSPKK